MPGPGAAPASPAGVLQYHPPVAPPVGYFPPESADALKKPRPRKPYTATKTREMWSAEEHARMLEGLKLFKRDWARVTEFVGTRSPAQVRSHAQKYFDRVAREKTDDYVPQARPKRKSAAPYPRKVRNEPARSPAVGQMGAAGPAPAPAGAYAPVFVPGASPYQLGPVAYAVAQMPAAMGHPDVYPASPAMPGVPGVAQVPAMPQMVVAHPQMMQHGVDAAGNPLPYSFVMPGAPPQSPQVYGAPMQMTRVFSPYLPGAPGASRPPVYSPTPHASPGAMAGAAYPAYPPGYAGRVDAASFYNMMSPLTPGVQYGLVSPGGQAPMPPGSVSLKPTAAPAAPEVAHVPRHSHPNGPDPNCAKCNALKRFGGVLHEMSALHKSKASAKAALKPPQQQAPPAPPARVMIGSPFTTPTPTGPPLERLAVAVQRVAQAYDAARPHHVPAARPPVPAAEAAALRRQERVRVLRSKRSSSASGSSSQCTESWSADGKRASSSPYVSNLIHNADGARVQKSTAAEKRTQQSRKRAAGASVAVASKKKKTACVSPPAGEQAGSSARKENVSPLSTGSAPKPAAYSQSERKEIFDAVQSLQILGRTPTPER